MNNPQFSIDIDSLHGGIMEKVYFSGLLSQFQDFYSCFARQLKDADIELIELKSTKDIWCRDFMPAKSASGNNLLFQYDPSYLKGKWQHKRILDCTLYSGIVSIKSNAYIIIKI